MMKRSALQVLFILIFCAAYGQEKIDYDAVYKIKQEGFNNSQVEEIAFHLIDESGPRLTNSPGYERAANWAVKQLGEWGLQDPNLESWGEFGKGWEVKKSYVAMTKPYYMPFIAVPKAWTRGTGGPVSGKVLFLDINSEADFEKYRGKLKGVIIAVESTGNQDPTFQADAGRYTADELRELEKYPLRSGNRPNAELRARYRARRELNQKKATFFREEGVALILTGRAGMHGTLFTSSARGYGKDNPPEIAELEVAPEYVNLLSRIVAHNEQPEVEAEVVTAFQDSDLNGYNVVAEIPGTDKSLREQVVMLGGHLDSWHGATGATDNAAGCIVIMEAVRILQETGLKPRRTIRIALWGAEEEGLHGSRNYVNNHFGDPENMKWSPEYENFSAYYNIDNGTGRIRGIYLQGNEAVRPIFEQWFEPFADIIDNTTLTIRNTGGTDHLAFNSVGLPGFQFIQDRIEYGTRTHHTNMDTYERLVMNDLKQMAVVVASFVYHTAQRDAKLPRKPVEQLSGN